MDVSGKFCIAVILLFPLALAGQQVNKLEIPTYNRDIAPVLRQYCTACHRPGGSAPFSLLTCKDAQSNARKIADVTQRRYMPPWLPQYGYGEFKDTLRLSDAQLRLIAEWVKAGAREGPPEHASSIPSPASDWQLGPPDMILKAQRPVVIPARGPDVFWNFIFSPELNATRYVRAIEIRPGASHAIHHANVYVDRTRSARRQERNPGEGFAGMDPTIERTPQDFDDGRFLSWKPGMIPYVEREGFSWRLDPGDDLVLNAHLPTLGKAEQLAPEVGLYFTDQPQTKFPMLLQLENDNALKIPPGARDFVVTDSFRLPLDVDVLAIYPHAHYLGHLLEGYATLPNGKRNWLVRIPKWDPHWQAVYRYRRPVFLPKGALIVMRFHYDNSATNPRNPNHPPKWVYGGDQSTDEMAHLWLQVLPRGPGDHRAELELAFLRERLKKRPQDFETLLHLGGLLLSRFDAQEAAPILALAVRVNPNHAEARNFLGAALQAAGRREEAVEQFRFALKLREDYSNARLNLVAALLQLRQYDEAITELRRLMQIYPEDGLTRDRLAEALDMRSQGLLTEGNWAKAESALRESVALSPENARRHVALGKVLELRGNFSGAMEQYGQALKIDPALDGVKEHAEELQQMQPPR